MRAFVGFWWPQFGATSNLSPFFYRWEEERMEIEMVEAFKLCYYLVDSYEVG